MKKKLIVAVVVALIVAVIREMLVDPEPLLDFGEADR